MFKKIKFFIKKIFGIETEELKENLILQQEDIINRNKRSLKYRR